MLTAKSISLSHPSGIGGIVVLTVLSIAVSASLLNWRFDSTVVCRAVYRSENYNFDRQVFGRRGTRYTGYLFILLFFFQPSFFLWTMLGFFLLFPSSFILFSLITHICFSMHKNDLSRSAAPNVCHQAVSDFFSNFLSYRFRLSYYY
jgi:hypothetical protein